MKIVAAIFIFSLCFAGSGSAQEKAKNILLFNAAGNSITLGSPVAVTNNSILLPGTLGLQGALMYISSVAGSVGSTTWLNPGTNGFILSLSGGLPAWSDPTTLLAGSYWSLAGNNTTTAYNGTTGSYLGTSSLFPLVLAATNATAQPIEFFNGGLERMRIASTGQLLIGTTTPTSTLTVNGETYSNTFLTQVNTGKPAYSEGRFFYDTAEKTMAYYNDHNGVTLNVGQEEWIRVKNVSGASIANGMAVYISGSDVATGLPTIALAKSDALATSECIGICTETIANNNTGYVTAFGVVHQLNTSAFSAGQALYVSPTTAGTLTGTRPLSPNFTTPVGYVAFVDASLGKILIRPGNTRFGLFTAGAIGFAGSDGWFKQSAANFFFDSLNSRLGIGTNTPGQSLEIKNGNLLLSNTATASQIQLQGTSTGISTFQAGAQGATNINYTLPTTLTATSTVGTGILQYTGTGALQWISPASLVSGSGWSTTGNAGTTPGVLAGQNYLGTSDAQSFIIATNSIERMRFLSTGNIGIGTTTPGSVLEINGRANGSLPSAGTISSSGTTVTGTGTTFTTTFQVGDEIIASNTRAIVSAIASDLSLTTVAAFNPAIAAGSSYGIVPTAFRVHGSSESITSLSNGNVGINNTTPGTTLHVIGRATSGAIGTLSSSGTTVTGTGTLFTVQVNPGDVITTSGQSQVVTAVANNTSLTTQVAFSPAISAGSTFTKQVLITRVESSTGIIAEAANALGNLGIGTTTPTVNLDIVRDIAFRETNYATSFASGSTTNDLSFDGLNPANQMSLVRLNAAAGPFTVTGFAGGQNGKLLSITNRTGQAMILANQTGSIAANQIFTGSGANITIAANGIANLQYSAVDSRWVLRSLGGSAGGGWSLSGNAGTTPGVAANQNYIGTSDAQNMIFATNATERMRILSTGNVSLNSATAPQLFTIGGDIGIVGSGSKITSSSTAKELIMEQTVDTYGTSRLRMQHRNGSNGALFETITGSGFSGIDVVDFGFKPGAGVQSNIRLEARAGTIRNSGNTVGEFEFYMDPTGAGQTYVMSVGKAATTIEVGNVGIGLVNPTSPLHITTGNTASGGFGMGANFNQTITAAANNDSLYGVSITPTFTNGAFTGLNNFALRAVYNGTLANGAAIRGKASGNGGASSEVIGVWGIATDATQGSNTNAGVGVRAEGNNTTTDLNSNIALQIVNGGFIVGRQASSALNDNTAGNNILAEDDANALTDQGPSGVVDITVNAAAASSVSSGTLVVDNRYAKSTSIVLLTPMNGGTSAPNGNESVSTRITARSTGTFTIEVRRTNPTAAAGGTNGTVRVGFLIINPGK